METFEWIIFGILIIVLLIVLILWFLRHMLEQCFLDADIDLNTVPGYTGSWLPWDTLNDIFALNRAGCMPSNGGVMHELYPCCDGTVEEPPIPTTDIIDTGF